MSDLAQVLHEISVSFGASTSVITLGRRLAQGLRAHLPVAEIEVAQLGPDAGSVRIAAFEPQSGATWMRSRSARYLERAAIHALTWSDPERKPTRISLAPIRARLEIPVRTEGLLSLAFEDPALDELETEERQNLLDALSCHCLRLGQLLSVARLCHQAHRNIVESREAEPAAATGETTPPEHERRGRDDTDISVSYDDTGAPPNLSSIREKITEIAVMTADEAMTACICRALAETGGRIYGDRGAAKLLDLKPSTLQSRMRRLGISRKAFVDGVQPSP